MEISIGKLFGEFPIFVWSTVFGVIVSEAENALCVAESTRDFFYYHLRDIVYRFIYLMMIIKSNFPYK